MTKTDKGASASLYLSLKSEGNMRLLFTWLFLSSIVSLTYAWDSSKSDNFTDDNLLKSCELKLAELDGKKLTPQEKEDSRVCFPYLRGFVHGNLITSIFAFTNTIGQPDVQNYLKKYLTLDCLRQDYKDDPEALAKKFVKYMKNRKTKPKEAAMEFYGFQSYKFPGIAGQPCY